MNSIIFNISYGVQNVKMDTFFQKQRGNVHPFKIVNKLLIHI